MIYFLFLTAFTVSIDSFVCGFSLAKSSNKKFSVITCVFLVVLVMCFITNYSALLLQNLSPVLMEIIGAIILVLVGIYNLIFTQKEQPEKIGSGTFIVAGFAVGLDGSMANLSLALMGTNDFFVPIVIAVMHAVMVGLGIFLSNSKILRILDKYKFFAPLILVGLGLYKLIGVFI